MTPAPSSETTATRLDARRGGLGAVAGTVLATALLGAAAPDVSADGESGWTWRVSPYLWAAGLSGRTGTLPGLPAADIDDSFSDIWDDLQFSGMVAASAQKGRWSIAGDVQYVRTVSKDNSLTPFFASEKLTSETFILSGLGEYAVAEQGKSRLWLSGGLRLWSVDTELELASGLFRGRTIKGDDTWVDPVLGARGNLGLGDSRFDLVGWSYVGGFGVGSDIMADLFGGLRYQLSDRFSATLGYRWMKVDRDEDGFLWDVTQEGPLAGITFRF